MKKDQRTVPKRLGQLAAGLAKIVADMDESKGETHAKIMKKKEK